MLGSADLAHVLTGAAVFFSFFPQFFLFFARAGGGGPLGSKAVEVPRRHLNHPGRALKKFLFAPIYNSEIQFFLSEKSARMVIGQFLTSDDIFMIKVWRHCGPELQICDSVLTVL
jgi:hypothetical protein